MSRLDDELKIAFQRQEPSPDFAARVLARINQAPALQPKQSAWQRLTGMFARPALRWAAAGAMALLLIIIGIAQLRSHQTAGVDNPSQVATSPGNPSSTDRGTRNPSEKNPAEIKAGTSTPDGGAGVSMRSTTAHNQAAPSAHTGGGRKSSHHPVNLVARQSPPSAEAEAAKEKVMFALQITSDTLNDVQRAISEDRPKDKPEPIQNR